VSSPRFSWPALKIVTSFAEYRTFCDETVHACV
jgi:hypothetical protein